MALKRRVYIGIAKAIRDSTVPWYAMQNLVNAVANAIYEDNPQFDIVSFKAIAMGGIHADEV